MKKLTFLAFLLVFFVTTVNAQTDAPWRASEITLPYADLDINSVSLVDSNIYWIAGFSTTAASAIAGRTTDGGANWEWFDNTSGIGDIDLYCVYGRSATEAYVGDGGAAGGAGGDAKVYRTTDGGQNWFVAMNTGGTVGFMNWVRFTSTNIGYAMSDDPGDGAAYVAKTTNGGTNWTRLAGTYTGAGYNDVVDYYDDNNLYYGGGVKYLVKTTDGGATWSATATNGTSGTASVGVIAFSGSSLFIGHNAANSGVWYSTDGGATWDSSTYGSGFKGIVQGASVHTNHDGTVATMNAYTSGVFITKNKFMGTTMNSGATWTNETPYIKMEDTAKAKYMLNVFCKKYDTDKAFFVGVSSLGYLLKKYYPGGVGVNEDGLKPGSFALSQNYPNPFNPSTAISYTIGTASNVSLKIYNAMGQEVRTLVNSNQTANTYNVTWDGKDNAGNYVSTGVYMYRLVAGNNVESKKMMFLK